MEEFFNNFVQSWYGITIIVILALVLLALVSSLFYKVFFKRFYDIVLSLIAIIVFSPFLVLLTIIGAIAMKGNPFFVQKRPSKINKKTGEEKIIALLKFRTMTNEKDENGNFLPDEKRLKKYGKFLRSTSLDELPSLFNIFIGDISIVGPRPFLVRDMVFMTDTQRERHKVRGGLTGLAQVNGRNNITWEKKFEYDVQYAKRITLFGDLRIIVKTVLKVVKREDTVREGTVSDIDLGDWLLEQGKISLEEYNEKQKEAKEILKG